MTAYFISVAPHPQRGTPGQHFYSWIYGRNLQRPAPVRCVICGESPAPHFTSRECDDGSTLTANWCSACENHEGLRAVGERVDQVINAVIAAAKEPARDFLLRQK